MTDPTARALRLLSLLQTGRRWSGGELAEALEVPPRTLRRSIDQLRALGYPVVSSRGPGGHYRLVAGKALPPLMLDDSEAVAALLALQVAARGGLGLDFDSLAADRAASKIGRVLPAGLRRSGEAVLAATDVAAPVGPQPRARTVNQLVSAINQRLRIRFEHLGRNGTTDRTVEPARLVHLTGRWYLLGWDRSRRDWRVFRLDRIAELEVTEERFTPREPPTGDLRHLVFGTPTLQVVLTLHTTADEAAARLPRLNGTLTPLAGGRSRYDVAIDSYEGLVVALVAAQLEFTVERPAAFAEHVARVGDRLRRAAAVAPSPPAELGG